MPTIAALGLLFFGALVAHPGQVLFSDYSDLLPLHLPAKRFLVRSWQQHGTVPLWCPYTFGGMPFVHDMQSSGFYPLHLPLFLVAEEHMGAALSWLVAAHVIIAGWCMYLYARSRALSQAGALVAAFGYMFAGKWLLHILGGGHYNMVPLAWLPLVLLWLEQAIWHGSLLKATWAGVAFAFIILGAYPYITLYAGWFIALWTFGTVLEKADHREMGNVRRWRQAVPVVAHWLGLGAWAALVAVALAAIQLLPGLEASAEASRSLGVAPSPDAMRGGLWSLVGLVGPPLTTNPDWLWENRVGLGVVWLALAVLAPVLRWRKTWFQVAACLVLLVFASGGAVALQDLPGFRFFQLPSRILLLLAVPVSLFAGASIDILLTATTDFTLRCRCQEVFLKIAGATIALLSICAIALRYKGEHLAFHPYWVSLLMTVPAAWWLLGRDLQAHPQWMLAWMGVLLGDLWALARPLVAVRPEGEIYAPSLCIRYLAAHRAEHGRVLDISPLGQAANSTPLWPGMATVYSIEGVRGFNPVDVLRYKEYLQLITDQDEPLRPLDRMFTSAVLGTFPIKNQSLADLLGIRYLLQPSQVPLEATVPGKEARKQWKKVPQAEDPAPQTFNFIPMSQARQDRGFQTLPAYAVYENSNVMPRAFVVPRAAPLPARPLRLQELKAANFRRLVFLEAFTSRSPQATLHGTFRQAAIREYLPNRVVVDIPAGGSGYLVLTDVWFPGWMGSVDGKTVPVYRADFLFRAVEIPAGAHQVVFTFAPLSYRLGKAISAATVFALCGIGLIALLRLFVFRRSGAEPKALACLAACPATARGENG